MTSIDGKGRILFSGIDEKGLITFGSRVNEFGHFILGGNVYSLLLTETLHISDTIQKSGTKYLLEPVEIFTAVWWRGFTHYLTEQVNIADDLLVGFYKILTETVHIVPSTCSELTRTITTNILLSVAGTKELIRTLQDNLIITPTLIKEKIYVLYEVCKLTIPHIKTTLTRNYNVTTRISDSLTFVNEFVMRKFNTTLLRTRKSSTLYRTKLSAKLQSIYNNAQLREQKNKARMMPVHDHTELKLEDGREFK